MSQQRTNKSGAPGYQNLHIHVSSRHLCGATGRSAKSAKLTAGYGIRLTYGVHRVIGKLWPREHLWITTFRISSFVIGTDSHMRPRLEWLEIVCYSQRNTGSSILTPSISAAPRIFAMPPASRSKASLPTWPSRERPQCPALPAQQLSPDQEKEEGATRDANLESPSGRCVRHSLRAGRDLPCPGRSGSVSLAQTETRWRRALCTSTTFGSAKTSCCNHPSRSTSSPGERGYASHRWKAGATPEPCRRWRAIPSRYNW